MTKICIQIAFVIILLGTSLKPALVLSLEPDLIRFQRIRSDSQLRVQLEKMIESAARWVFEPRAGFKPVPTTSTDALLRDPLPLFITAKKEGRVRGCMGNLETKTSSLQSEIEKTLKLAFTQDPQHQPIQRSELSGMEIFVTVVGNPSPMTSVSSISPARDGILIRSGMKEAVVLPGEAKTTRYLLAFAKAKAGIRRGESFQVFRLPSETMSFVLNDESTATESRGGEKEGASPQGRVPTGPTTP